MPGGSIERGIDAGHATIDGKKTRTPGKGRQVARATAEQIE